ncbi:MAG: hypothetical protein NTV06_02390, partial [candidate division Zixibacteria bacterium]|nr:hypothetical protein [candidate division Zixibacteria bacterium]
LSLAENLLYPLIIRGDTVFSQKAKLKQILAQFDLFSKRDEKASHLGRNHQILAMLARAVIADQPLLLIDEPFDRLNREMAAIIPDTLRRLSAAGHTIIILTADHSGLDMPNVSKYQIKGGSLQ